MSKYSDRQINEMLRSFRLYRHISSDAKTEFKLFLTPENIFGVRENEVNVKTVCNYVNDIDKMSVLEITERLSDDFWSLGFVFVKLIEQFNIYISLRPEIYETYPEYCF